MVTKASDILENGHVEGQFSMVAGGSGLTRTIRAGTFVRGDTVNQISETTVTVADDITSYIYLDTNTLTIVDSTTFPVELFVMIFEVLAVSGVLTTILDWRSRSSGLIDLV